MYIIDRFKVESREILNPLFASSRRKEIQPEKEDFTIISNTCWAGHVYRYFGLPYLSPTIGTGFFADDYIKFVTSLKDYLSMDMKMITARESKHWEQIQHHHPRFQVCPYGVIGDIEVRFGHYKTPEEALAYWNRRRSRVNYDNIIIKFSEHNGCTPEILKAFDELAYERKFVFVARDHELKSQVIFKEYEKLGDVKDDTVLFRKYINLPNLINGEPFVINQ